MTRYKILLNFKPVKLPYCRNYGGIGWGRVFEFCAAIIYTSGGVIQLSSIMVSRARHQTLDTTLSLRQSPFIRDNNKMMRGEWVSVTVFTPILHTSCIVLEIYLAVMIPSFTLYNVQRLSTFTFVN